MAKDVYHEQVKTALLKDGWVITHDPLHLEVGGVDFYVDLGAEQILAAEKQGKEIAIEIKSLKAISVVSEFHTALGQFLNYRLALTTEHPTRTLYLAIPEDVYNSFFKLEFTRNAVSVYELKLLIFDPAQEVIVEWRQ